VRVAVPAELEQIVDEFADAPDELRIEMLFEYSEQLPPLPAELAAHTGMEQVTECQTPFFLLAEVRPDHTVAMTFDCPPEAPTTRGFAGILAVGLQGASAEDILSVPDDFYLRMGLGSAISPLRLRGMAAILARLKRQVREGLAAVAA
jgi:cysteine desulfuration protein SufE